MLRTINISERTLLMAAAKARKAPLLLHTDQRSSCKMPWLAAMTNNACGRNLRPAVVQRKMMNGYRAPWAVESKVDVCTVFATAKLGSNAIAFVTLACRQQSLISPYIQIRDKLIDAHTKKYF